MTLNRSCVRDSLHSMIRRDRRHLVAVGQLGVRDLDPLAAGDIALHADALGEAERKALVARARHLDLLAGLVVLDRADDDLGLRLGVRSGTGLLDNRLGVRPWSRGCRL